MLFSLNSFLSCDKFYVGCHLPTEPVSLYPSLDPAVKIEKFKLAAWLDIFSFKN